MILPKTGRNACPWSFYVFKASVRMWGRPSARGGLSGRPELENSALLVALQLPDSEVASPPAFARDRPAFVRYLPPARQSPGKSALSSFEHHIGRGVRHDGPAARSSPMRPDFPQTTCRCPARPRFNRTWRPTGTLSGSHVGDHAEPRPSAGYAACERVEVSRLAQGCYRQASQQIAPTDRPTLLAGREL